MQNIKEYVAQRKEAYKNQDLTDIIMSIIQVGHNPASDRYVKNKIKDLTEVGITANLIALDENITEELLINRVEELKANPYINLRI